MSTPARTIQEAQERNPMQGSSATWTWSHLQGRGWFGIHRESRTAYRMVCDDFGQLVLA